MEALNNYFKIEIKNNTVRIFDILYCGFWCGVSAVFYKIRIKEIKDFKYRNLCLKSLISLKMLKSGIKIW